MALKRVHTKQPAGGGEPASTHDRILAETMRLIARDGVEELKIKDIADAVGVRMPSLYKHFENRDAIVAELSRRMVREVAASVQADADLPPEQWIKHWARQLVRFYVDRPAYVRLVLRDLATPGGYEKISNALGPVAETAKTEPLKTFNEQFDRIYAMGVRAGELEPIDRSDFFSTMFGMVLVTLAWPYSGRPKLFRAADVERLQSRAASVAWQLAAARKRRS